jgi:hypothetical protein
MTQQFHPNFDYGDEERQVRFVERYNPFDVEEDEDGFEVEYEDEEEDDEYR